MNNYKDMMAYKLYKMAEENLESGKAVEELYEKILKEILHAVSLGRKETWFPTEEYLLKVVDGAVEVLTDMGFKVFQDAHGEDELYILWDFSEEESEEGGNELN